MFITHDSRTCLQNNINQLRYGIHRTFLTLALIATSRFGRSIAGRRYAWAVLHRIPFQILPCTLLNPKHVNKRWCRLLITTAIAPAMPLSYNLTWLSVCGKSSGRYLLYCNFNVTACRRHSMLVVVICDPPTLASSSFHARGQVTATVVSLFMVPSCGILCHTTCGQLTCLWPLSEIDWKHSCLTVTSSSAFVALANLGYTSDIIIIIIIKELKIQNRYAQESCTP